MEEESIGKMFYYVSNQEYFYYFLNNWSIVLIEDSMKGWSLEVDFNCNSVFYHK